MKERENTSVKPRASERIVGFSADKRKLIYVIAVLLTVCCILTSVWTPATRTLASYMPGSTNAGRGAKVLDAEFDDLGTADVFLENVSLTQCEYMRDRLSELEGVYSVEFDEYYYHHGRGVLNVTFDSPDAEDALETLKNEVRLFDGGIATDIGSGWGFGWGVNISMIILFAAAAVILSIALIYSSRAYRDVFVSFVITAFAILINYGTNFILGRVSPITMLSAGVIQAALTMYYAMMICRSYTAHRKTDEQRESVVKAVTGSMKKILAAGVIALAVFGGLMFAGIHLGLEFGIVTLKGIALSMLCVYFFLPCLLMTNANKIDRSRHPSLLPKIKKRGRFTFNTKKVFPILFAILAIGALVFNYVYPEDPLAYSDSKLPILVKSGSQWIGSRIEYIFGEEPETMDMLVPVGDTAAEEAVTRELTAMENVVSVKSLANTPAATYNLGDRISPWQLSDITGIDMDNSTALFESYITDISEGSAITTDRELPFADIFRYTCDRLADGSLAVSEAVAERINEVDREVTAGTTELHGETYDRLVIGVKLPYDSIEAAGLADAIREAGQRYYEDEIYLTGDVGSVSDMAARYKLDMIIVMAVTSVLLICALFILLRKPGISVVLTFIVQGGAWLSMAVPYLFPGYILFAGQMLGYGVQVTVLATYAALMASRYNKNKKDATLKWAIGKAMKDNYIPIVVTGALLILSGAVLAVLSFNAAVVSFGICVALGGVIDLIVGLAVVPQTLLFWDIIVSKATHTPVVLSSAPAVPPENEGRMDIVDAIEKLKSDEYKAMMEEPTVALPDETAEPREEPAAAPDITEFFPEDEIRLPEEAGGDTPPPEEETVVDEAAEPLWPFDSEKKEDER